MSRTRGAPATAKPSWQRAGVTSSTPPSTGGLSRRAPGWKRRCPGGSARGGAGGGWTKRTSRGRASGVLGSGRWSTTARPLPGCAPRSGRQRLRGGCSRRRAAGTGSRRAEHPCRQGGHGRRQQTLYRRARHGHRHPAGARVAEYRRTGPSRHKAEPASDGRVHSGGHGAGHARRHRTPAQGHDTAAGDRGGKRRPHGGRIVRLPGCLSPATGMGHCPFMAS